MFSSFETGLLGNKFVVRDIPVVSTTNCPPCRIRTRYRHTVVFFLAALA